MYKSGPVCRSEHGNLQWKVIQGTLKWAARSEETFVIQLVNSRKYSAGLFLEVKLQIDIGHGGDMLPCMLDRSNGKPSQRWFGQI